MECPDVPHALVLESFRGCNMRCPHCNVPWIGNPGISKTGAMSLRVFESLASLLPVACVVGYDSMGEPTLNPLLCEFIRRQKMAAPCSMARLTSNLLGLSPVAARQLLEAGLDELQVSIDAGTESVFRASRKGSTLRDTIDAITLVRNTAAALGLDRFRLVCCFVATSNNITELPRVACLVAGLGVEGLFVNGLEPYSEADYRTALWASESGRAVARSVFRQTLRVRDEERLSLTIALPSLAPRSSGCGLPWETMTVNFDGSVSPCFVAGMETRVWNEAGEPKSRQSVIFGNVLDREPVEIWSSPEYEEFRLRAREGGDSQPMICRACLRGCGVICTSATSPSWSMSR